MHQLQRSWVRSQHPSAQWNLRGGRWSSAEFSTEKKETYQEKNCCIFPPSWKLLLKTTQIIKSFPPVFQIHEILVWIQIRICRSVPLSNGSGCRSESCYFRHWPSRRQQKTNKKKFFCLYCNILKVHLHNFSKIKSSKEVTNRLVDPDPGGPKTCGSGFRSWSGTLLPT